MLLSRLSQGFATTLSRSNFIKLLLLTISNITKLKVYIQKRQEVFEFYVTK